MSVQKKKFIIIDANSLIHRSYHALPPLVTKDGKLVNAVYGFATVFLKVIRELAPDYLAVAFDVSRETFRRQLYKGYKAQRVKQPQELYAQIPLIKKLLTAFKVKVFELRNYEADDVIGTLTQLAAVKQAEPKSLKNIIVTGDLDALQLIDQQTEVYTLKKGIADTAVYNRQTVKQRYGLTPEQLVDFKALRGDPSDNIPGVKGIGEKGAIELLKKFGTLERLYSEVTRCSQSKTGCQIKRSVLEKLQQGKQSAFLSKQLAQIKRNLKINFSLADCRRQEPDLSQVVKLFQELEFKSLLDKLSKLSDNQTTAQGMPAQTEKQTLMAVQTKFTLLTEPTQVDKFLQLLAKQKIFSLDTETNDLNALTADLLGLSFSWQAGKGFYLPWQILASKQLKILKKILEDEKIKKIGHNLKYDIQVLKGQGINLGGLAFDTMIAAYLLYPGWRSYALDNLAFSELGVKMMPIESLIGKRGKDQKKMSQIPLRELAAYAAEDADITYRLYKKFSRSLKGDTQFWLFREIELPLVKILAEMERWGIKIDVSCLKNLSRRLKGKIASLEKKIYQLTGQQFNIASPRQLKQILFEKLGLSSQGLGRTKTGISTAADELEKLRGQHKIIDLILEFREYTKLVNTYTEALPRLVNPATNRVHTSFNQTVTATGRLSSSDPNLQNIPIRSHWGRTVRKAFVAEKGYQLISADYSQIELRIIASLSGDEKMIESFKRSEDIHARTAAEIFDIDIDEVTPRLRREAKEVNFGILYGLGPRGIALRAGIPLKRAQWFYEKYFTLHQRIKDCLEAIKKTAREKGYVETLFGRRRYLPAIKAEHHLLRSQAERMAVNMPVQGTAADLIKLAMVRLAEELKAKNRQEEIRMLLQVHDELVFEVKDQFVKEASRLIRERMEDVYELAVPIKVHLGIGRNWDEAK